jgi:AraC family transcriptional regulator, transcriptional activator of pobA
MPCHSLSPARKPSRPAIPQFALYGETALTHKPEFAHIESIPERSERNGWLIKPHRHSHLFQVLFMYNGAAHVRLDTMSSRHAGCWLVTMPPGVVHGFEFEPGTQGVVLSLAIGMLGLDADNQVGKLLDGLLAKPHIVKYRRQSPEYRELFQYLGLVRQELEQSREDQQIALFALVKMVLLSLRRHLRREHQDAVLQSGGVQLVNRFRGLLERHYRQHWKIADYAAELHVSVSTLNRACNAVLACTAKKLIQERLHIEAKRRLMYTRETLDQISYALGFKDAPYFSRVFKQIEGAAPKHFRRAAVANSQAAL